MIINADDLGYDDKNNDRIFEAFEKGWISSATVMANMPGFPSAVETIISQKLIDLIGIHINLDTGPALSSKMLDLEPDAQLRTPRNLIIREPHRVEAIREEISVQIETAQHAGLPLSHADSHHHLHTHWTILSQVIKVCKPSIRSLRLGGNLLFPSSAHKRFYRTVVNRRIKASGFITTDYFTYLDRFLTAEPTVHASKVIELMVHPGVDDEFNLFKSDAFARLLDRFELISYTNFYQSVTKLGD